MLIGVLYECHVTWCDRTRKRKSVDGTMTKNNIFWGCMTEISQPVSPVRCASRDSISSARFELRPLALLEALHFLTQRLSSPLHIARDATPTRWARNFIAVGLWLPQTRPSHPPSPGTFMLGLSSVPNYTTAYPT